MTQVAEEEDVQLLPGLRDLKNSDNVVGPHGDLYIGGLRELVIPHPVDQQPAIYYVIFTDGEERNGSGLLSNEDFDQFCMPVIPQIDVHFPCLNDINSRFD